MKKADKLYENQGTFEETVENIKKAVEEIKALGPGASDALSGYLGELLMAASNVARICKLPQEQILADKIDDLIEKYE